jgi:hypothetical protein
MGVNVSAYVERKNQDGSWELVTTSPVSSNLKNILKDYNEYGNLEWDDLSAGLKEKFKKDESGNCYCSFHTVTMSELEGEVESSLKQTFTRVNTIVEALGCTRIYRDDGEELGWGDDGEDKDKLTFPINKKLVEDLQYALDTMRDIGRREAFDLFVDEHMEWGKEYRVVLVVC